jgi:GT2 family glycosyltransferase
MTSGLDFSIVIPTRDRAAQLARCLDALARLDYPPDRLEVVVVDDGGRQPLRAVFDSATLPNLRVVTLTGVGPATSRNAGAAAASAPLLAFTDDDCEPAPDWLRALERRLSGTPGAIVGGRAVNALTRNRYAAASQLLVDYLHGYYNRPPADARFLTSNNLALSAEVFRRIGGFDERFGRAGGEDRELGHRARRLGHRLVYAPEAVVHHFHGLTPRGFWGQHFRYGRGAAQFRRAAGLRGLRLEPLAFYRDLVAYPRGNGHRGDGLALSGLLAVSQVANAAGFAYERLGGGE